MDFRYQKNLTFQLLFEHQQVFDGQLIDDRANTSSKPGTDVFGRAASTETRASASSASGRANLRDALTLLGAELKQVSQTGIYGNDDPGVGVELAFGTSSCRPRPTLSANRSGSACKTTMTWLTTHLRRPYNPAPHRFGMDVVWPGTASLGRTHRLPAFARGWAGPARRLTVYGSMPVGVGGSGQCAACCKATVLLGTAAWGGTTGLPAAIPLGQDYDIFAGGIAISRWI